MNKAGMPPFVDLHRIDESTRIQLIAEQASTKLVAVAIDDDKDKIARYIKGVTEANDKVRHIDTGKGLVKGTKLLRFGPKAKN